MARKSLKAVKPDTQQAAQVAAKLAGKSTEPEIELDQERETASFNLPVELIELLRELADERLKLARAERRAAKRAGIKDLPQTRRSASNVVAEALEAYRGKMEAELKALQGK